MSPFYINIDMIDLIRHGWRTYLYTCIYYVMRKVEALKASFHHVFTPL